MEIYVIRHGQTQYNKEDLVCGCLNPSLNCEGIEQVKKISKELVGKGISLIIASPMTRTCETADIISKRLGLSYTTDDRIVEQNCGVFEGEKRTNKQYCMYRKNFAYRYPYGESTFEVVARVYDFLNDMIKKYKKERMVVVTHGGISRVINTFFCDMDNEQFYKFQLKNSEILYFKINE